MYRGPISALFLRVWLTLVLLNWGGVLRSRECRYDTTHASTTGIERRMRSKSEYQAREGDPKAAARSSRGLFLTSVLSPGRLQIIAAASLRCLLGTYAMSDCGGRAGANRASPSLSFARHRSSLTGIATFTFRLMRTTSGSIGRPASTSTSMPESAPGAYCPGMREIKQCCWV